MLDSHSGDFVHPHHAVDIPEHQHARMIKLFSRKEAKFCKHIIPNTMIYLRLQVVARISEPGCVSIRSKKSGNISGLRG